MKTQNTFVASLLQYNSYITCRVWVDVRWYHFTYLYVFPIGIPVLHGIGFNFLLCSYFLCTNQCGITLERLQSASPHALSVNSGQSRQAIMATELTDTASVTAEGDCEGSAFDTEDENC